MNQRILVFSALAFAGCGGSGGPGGGGPVLPITVVIHSAGPRDGSIRGSGFVQTSSGLFVGDIDGITPGDSSRAVVGFDLAGAGVPATATIQTAVIVLEQVGSVGSPFTDLGNVLVDHVDLGAAIDFADYGSSAVLAAFGVFATDATTGLKTLDVGPRVQADLAAGRTFSDFRFRFPTVSDGDAADDYTQFIDAENWTGPGATPVLKVNYLP